MTVSEMKPRPSVEIDKDLQPKHARREALRSRLPAIDQEIETLRDQQGRALASGADFKGAQKIAALTNEQDATQRAIDLLTREIGTLEAQRAQSVAAETKIADATAYAAAIEAVERVESIIHTACEREIFPAMERVTAAIRNARSAESGYDASVAEAGGKVSPFKDNTSKIMGTRGQLVGLIEGLHKFVDGRSQRTDREPAPAATEETSLALR